MKLREELLDNRTKSPTYRQLSLVSLIRLIVNSGDRLALHELHENRSIFHYRGSKPLTLVEYLDLCRKNISEGNWFDKNGFSIADDAYDLTLDKFSSLPENTIELSRSKSEDKKSYPLEQKGPDCRNYFKAFLDMISDKDAIRNPGLSQVEEEIFAATVLQRLVTRHFFLSLKESIRSANKVVSRYFWKVNGGTICLWFPKSMSGTERRTWLEKNIGNPDPFRPGERDRIQDRINNIIPLGSVISLDACQNADHVGAKGANVEYDTLSQSIANEVSVKGLARAVADEKKDTIEQQRPAIRALGKAMLGEMIECIFSDLSEDDYQDTRMARQFNLSKATFSRFAGIRWSEQYGKKEKLIVPDLWENTAKILASHPAFVEAAKDAGVWEKVKVIRET